MNHPKVFSELFYSSVQSLFIQFAYGSLTQPHFHVLRQIDQTVVERPMVSRRKRYAIPNVVDAFCPG